MHIEQQFCLKPYNSFAVSVRAAYFCRIGSLRDLQQLLADPGLQPLPWLVLGGGTNLLLTRDFPGLVIKIELTGKIQLAEDDEFVYWQVAAGENWHQWVNHSLAQGYYGLENLALIPGSVGAAPIQNIGAYGAELKDVLYEVTAWQRKTGAKQLFTQADCQLDYRDSFFKRQGKNQYIISSVTFRLNKRLKPNLTYPALQRQLAKLKTENLSAQDIYQSVCELRQTKLPNPQVLGNAGSFFKNPIVTADKYQQLRQAFPQLVAFPQPDNRYKLAAAWLIEACGYKGKRLGDAGIYQQQALILVNHGQATGKQLWHLAQQVQQAVKAKFAVELQPEPVIL
jgi:UDP-N-acetylmuramate dehydrogenase